jgi:ubiquinone/menaquinone biosynthesis C-methylase UbiE
LPDKTEWFREGFNNTYKGLYSHRHGQQAAQQVSVILDLGLLPPEATVLDIACGAGRHMLQFKSGGISVFGLDLNRQFLNDARKKLLPVAQADMRTLPFTSNRFHLITCFFSSFGYFATQEEDGETLREFKRLTKPSGHIFLDLVNKVHVLNNLVPEDVKEINGQKIRQVRHLENDLVVKTVTVYSEGEPTSFQERLRLYSRKSITKLCNSLGLEVTHIFGDEQGTPFSESDSPRLALVLKKVE